MTFSIPLVDLQYRGREEREALRACFESVLDKGDFIGGDAVGEFERAVESYLDVDHCVALNSGTDALIIGMKALGIGPGDEVITPPNSFIASTASIAACGATPVFADVTRDQVIDPAEVEKKITPRTKAVMAVHWTGRMGDMHALERLCALRNIYLIEDAAQAMGARYMGEHPGSFSSFAAFSAHPLKNLNALGDGGFLVTNSAEIAEFSRLYRNHGLQGRDTCVMYGINSRLDTLHAKVLGYRLSRLDEVIGKRRRNVELYRRYIRAPQVVLPQEHPWEYNAYTMFIVQAESRDKLKGYLAEFGIQSLVYYGTPLHLQPACAHLGYKRGDFPVAEGQAERVLALPHHQHLSEDQICYVARKVNEFYGV